MPKRHMLNIAVIFALITIPVYASAYTVYEAELVGSEVVPPSSSQSSGFVTFVLNDEETEVFYVIELSALEGGSEIATLIQNAGPGENGPVFFMLPKGTTKDGLWSISPFEVAELKEGRVYVAVYTNSFPSGELRGNLGEPASPIEEGSWGSIKALY